jgi:hypothetical protein
VQKSKSSAPAEPEPIERWTAQRKAAIILEVLKGQISVPEAARNPASRKAIIASGPTSSCAAASKR